MDDKKTRLYYIDNLRTLLIIMVILWHMAATYGAPGFWPYQESRPDDLTGLVYTVFSAINQPYVLGFFFMIAGYFTPGSYDRKGPATFFKERLVRLGIPLLIYTFLFDPLIYYAIRINSWGFDGSFWRIWGIKGTFWLFWKGHVSSYSQHGPGVGPMWFIEMMLIFIIAYGLGRLVFRVISSSSRNRTPINRKPVPGNLSIGIFALILGLSIFAMRIWLPINSYYEPLGLPMAYVPQYILLFFVGINAYRSNWFQRIPMRARKVWLGIILFLILILFPLIFALGGALEGRTDPYIGGVTWQSFAYSVWEEFICIGMIIVLLTWFREKFNHQSSLAKAMSDSSYTVFFIHAPVLVFLALGLRTFDAHPLLKWILVSPLAIILCFAIAFLIKKTPLLRNVL